MKTNIKHFFTALIFYSFLTLSNKVSAQAGSLDLSFDSDGIVTTPFGSFNDLGYGVAIQADGKIVVTGTVADSNHTFLLVRYHVNGSLDSSFDVDGKVMTPFGGYTSGANAVAIQADGKIVVAGTTLNNGTSYDFALVRYNTNGSLDSSFDVDGKVITDLINIDDGATSMAIQTDGKIVLAGRSNSTGVDNIFALVRYNIDGSLDTSFDADGKVTTDLGNDNDVAYSMAIQADGKIVVAGTASIGNNYDFALVRYNSNGSLDTSFDTDGKVITEFGNFPSSGNSVAIQSDGKIVVAGFYNNNYYGFALARYNTNGSLDNGFDIDGKVTSNFVNGSAQGFSVALQSDGKIIVTGIVTTNFVDLDFALARYHTNGSLDLSFDNDGQVTTDIANENEFGHASAIQADGKIVVVGTSFNGNNEDIALARYNCCLPTSLETVRADPFTVNIFPNPFNTRATIQFKKAIYNGVLSIYNIFDEKIKTITPVFGQSITLYRDDLSNGMYFIKLAEEGEEMSAGKMVLMD